MSRLRTESPSPASGKLGAWLQGAGRGVAITGASGWIGAAMAHAVLEAAPVGKPLHLRLFGSRPRPVRINGRCLPVEALAGAEPLGPGEWLVLHMAVAGADRIASPEERRRCNDEMLADALALAQGARTRRFVHASSGAVHAAAPEPQAEREAYRLLKREQEERVAAWGRRTGVPVLTPRIFNVGGPYVTSPRRYALGDFILQARTRGVIEVAARRPVERSYVHGLELAAVTFELALGEEDSLAFDTAGTEVVEMAALAQAVGRALAIPALEVRRAPLEDAPPDRYVGDGAIYRSALAAAGLEPIGLGRIIGDTAAFLQAAPAG